MRSDVFHCFLFCIKNLRYLSILSDEIDAWMRSIEGHAPNVEVLRGGVIVCTVCCEYVDTTLALETSVDAEFIDTSGIAVALTFDHLQTYACRGDGVDGAQHFVALVVLHRVHVFPLLVVGEVLQFERGSDVTTALAGCAEHHPLLDDDRLPEVVL